MPFGRLHEEAAGEDKLLNLSDAAWRMWGMGLIYCQKNLTDGFVDERAIDRWGIKVKNLRSVTEELCREQVKDRSPLWSRVDGGFQVHDYLQWNDSKEDILSARASGRERIKRFRERERDERERERQERERLRALVTERPPTQNALQVDEQPAHDVVRGSGEDLQEERDPKIPRGAVGRSDGVFGASLPKYHLKCAACDETYSRCVPLAVHEKLANALAPKHGGDRQAAKAALLTWYSTVWATLPADFVMPDAFRFWQGRFDAAFASADPHAGKAGERKNGVPDVDQTQAYLRNLRNPDARPA